MSDECTEWILECREAFPKLDRFTITSEYKKLGKNVLGRVKGQVERYRDIKPKSIFLDGEVKFSTKTKEEHSYQIFINEKLKKVEPDNFRKQVIQNIMTHELLHIENKDLTTLSKKYSRRMKKKIHVSDFHKECLDRFNQIRKINNINPIKSYDQLKEAESKIATKLKI